jgi:uncharacterized protein (DUF4415 family)
MLKPEYDFSQAKRGAVVPQTGRTPITIYIDDTMLAKFRARGDSMSKGYQSMMNEALNEYLEKVDRQPLTEETLRRVIQEELRAAK